MSDEKSTNDIRMIAQDVTHQQAQVCEARRDNLEDKLQTISDTVSANVTAIAALTQTVTTLAASVRSHDEDIKKLRPAFWTFVGSAVGSAVPIVVGLLFWLMSR